MDANFRNFKDFLQIYNNLSHNCFKTCVDNLNSRTLDDNEAKCVDLCAEKFLKLNHRVMAIYVDKQQVIVNKRVKELEEQAIQDQAKQEQLIQEQAKLEQAKIEPISDGNGSDSAFSPNSDSTMQPTEVSVN